MTGPDIVLLALTAWRENRGGGYVGMQSVINVIMNRAAKRNTTPYIECTRPEQFSSITVPGPEAALWPAAKDEQWNTALSLAQLASLGRLDDITGMATVYYAPKGISSGKTIAVDGVNLPFPASWNAAALTYTATIADQVFFREAPPPIPAPPAV